MDKAMGFEAGLARLEELLALLQDDKTPLADAVRLYAEAAELIACCDETLRNAKLEIEEIDARLKGSSGEGKE